MRPLDAVRVPALVATNSRSADWPPADASIRPSLSSAAPAAYDAPVSKTVMPHSSAASNTLRARCSEKVGRAQKLAQPSPIRDTFQPVRPSGPSGTGLTDDSAGTRPTARGCAAAHDRSAPPARAAVAS